MRCSPAVGLWHSEMTIQSDNVQYSTLSVNAYISVGELHTQTGTIHKTYSYTALPFLVCSTTNMFI